MINWQHLFLPLFTVPQYLFCANSTVSYSFKTYPSISTIKNHLYYLNLQTMRICWMIFAKMEIAIWEIIITILNIYLDIVTMMRYIVIMVCKIEYKKFRKTGSLSSVGVG